MPQQNESISEEARVGISLLRSLKSILQKILRGGRSGRISNAKRSFVNMVNACIHNCNDGNQLSMNAIGRQVGMHRSSISRSKIKSYNRVALIKSGDKKGYEFVDTDQKRSKFTNEEITKFEKWIKKDCQLVIENPLKMI